MGFTTRNARIKAWQTQHAQHCKKETPSPNKVATSPCKSPPTPALTVRTPPNVLENISQKRKLSITRDIPQPAQKRPKVMKLLPKAKPTFFGVIVPWKAKPTFSPLLSKRLGKQVLLRVEIPKRPPPPPPLAPWG